jgi:hypothetical protein
LGRFFLEGSRLLLKGNNVPNRGRTEIGGFAATYKGNGLLTSDSLLESGSPNDLVDRLDYLQKPAQHETRALDGFLAARLAAKDADNQTMLAQQKADSARRSSPGGAGRGAGGAAGRRPGPKPI